MAGHGLILNSSVEFEDNAEDEEKENKQVETLNLPSIISLVETACNGLQNLGNNASFPQNELLNSLDSFSPCQHKLQALKSAIDQAKNEKSKQMSIHDFF